MNWGIFNYAGPTALAWVALVVSAISLMAVAWGIYEAFKKNVRVGVISLVSTVLVYVGSVFLFGPKLAHSWLYLQENATRSYITYASLTFATAFIPPTADEGVNYFVRIASRDSGFSKGVAKSTEKIDGHEIAIFQDEDYVGNVITMDGRPVDTGLRFVETRRIMPLVSVFENPSAKSCRIVGSESFLYTNAYSQLGMKFAEKKEKADIILVVPEPDWICGADTPSAGTWREISYNLATNGVIAYHVDARLLSRARLKKLLADFRAVFNHYRLWCVGRYDYVLTASRQKVQMLELLDLFDDPKKFEVFANAGVVSPAEMFACYVGTDYEVEPGLVEIDSASRMTALFTAPRLAFGGAVQGRFSPVTAPSLTPLQIPHLDWLDIKGMDSAVYDVMTNRIFLVQCARRDILLGFADADGGASSNALAKWSAAAEINHRDPLLRGLADSLDLEGRRRLRIGNPNGALRCYENRLTIYPKDVASIHNFGVCLKKSGHPDIAAKVFAKAVQLDPMFDEHRLELIECAAASSREPIAVRQLEVLIKRHPDDPSLKLRAAKLLSRRENPERDEKRAIAYAEEAVRMTGWKDRAYVQGLADVYIDAGQPLLGVGLKKKMRTMKFDK
jgi:tetratricopeptide (TPR) repeat protein